MPEKDRIQLYVASLRLERWPRSLAIFPGLAMAFFISPSHRLSSTLLIWPMIAFFLTWAVSTVNYIVNEITDAPFDAHHPEKMHRPLVKKEIRRRWLAGFGLLLMTAAYAMAYAYFSLPFFLALLSLLVAGFFYNVKPIRMKDIPYVDSTLESANNPIRFLIGWYILQPAFPPIPLLLSWWAFGNFLMVGKRVAEKRFLTAEQSAAYRLSLKRYSFAGLIVFMIFNAVAFIATFILFAIGMHLKLLLFTVPFILLYLVFFMVKSIQDRETAEEPEKLLKNPYFAIYTFFLVAIIVLAFLLR